MSEIPYTNLICIDKLTHSRRRCRRRPTPLSPKEKQVIDLHT